MNCHTSPTERNRSGLSSVTNFFALSVWQSEMLMHDCVDTWASCSTANSGSDPLTSKTRTWLSPAAVTLGGGFVTRCFNRWLNRTHTREELGSIFALKILARWPVRMTQRLVNGYSCRVLTVSIFQILTVVSSPPLRRSSPPLAQLKALTQLHGLVIRIQQPDRI